MIVLSFLTALTIKSILLLAGGFVLYSYWGWFVSPSLFDPISYFQAVGLFALLSMITEAPAKVSESYAESESPDDYIQYIEYDIVADQLEELPELEFEPAEDQLRDAIDNLLVSMQESLYKYFAFLLIGFLIQFFV